MKKVLLFFFTICMVSNLQAELFYTHYGPNGWNIGLNENVAVDIDNDGSNDFYVNSWNNELGFVPIFGKGCFSSPGSQAINNLGSRELTIHQAGEILDISVNTFDFIDDDRGSGFSATTNQLASGWVDGEDHYIGFFIFTSSRFGWMKVSIDVNSQKLIIKEMAYESESYGSIEIGNTGQAATIPTMDIKETSGILEAPVANEEIEKEIQELSIYPNPAVEQVNINFDYQGVDQLSITVVNNIGQEVYQNISNLNTGAINLEISTSTWDTGIYFIRFQSEQGIKTEKLVISK